MPVYHTRVKSSIRPYPHIWPKAGYLLTGYAANLTSSLILLKALLKWTACKSCRFWIWLLVTWYLITLSRVFFFFFMLFFYLFQIYKSELIRENGWGRFGYCGGGPQGLGDRQLCADLSGEGIFYAQIIRWSFPPSVFLSLSLSLDIFVSALFLISLSFSLCRPEEGLKDQQLNSNIWGEDASISPIPLLQCTSGLLT